MKSFFLKVNDLLPKHKLNVHVLAYVKDERTNVFIVTFVLTLIMSCQILQMSIPFVGAC
jgi:hypothetical protein